MGHMRILLVFIFLWILPMNKIYTAEQYIQDVQSGEQVACKFVKLAVERHLDDLKRAEAKNPDFPYYFDKNAAKRVIDFKQELRHTQGEWANPRKHDTRIRLEPWQQFIDWVLFGWRREGGSRRFTKAYIEVAKKNGKTTDAAATANYCFTADRPREIGPEVYIIATKKDQARKAFDEAQRQLDRHPVLKKITHYYKQTSTIVIPGTASLMRLLGKESKTEDSVNPHFVLVDEYHAHRDSGMLEVMESALGAREQPLVYIITTAGLDKSNPCYQEERSLAERVLEKSIQPAPETFFCIIFTLDKEDDWMDPAVWIKANPNLGVSVRWEYLEKRMEEALLIPSRQNRIKTKNLNIWTQAETRWMTDEVWKACAFPVDPEALAGRPCYGGMDLSASQDITAVVWCFPPQSELEKYQFLFRFFIPEENVIVRERRDKVPYIYWIEKGLVMTTPGNSIDYDFIEQQILQDAGLYEIQELGFDPWKSHEIVNHMMNEGLLMVAIRQSYYGMAQPTDIFEKKVLARKIAHGGDPVMNWMISCTEVKSDRQDNKMPMKPQREKTGKRIDGVTASIMALGRSVMNTEELANIEIWAV